MSRQVRSRLSIRKGFGRVDCSGILEECSIDLPPMVSQQFHTDVAVRTGVLSLSLSFSLSFFVSMVTGLPETLS